MIDRVDEFVIYDDMQYTKRDWRNRNKIKTADGAAWLTIPVAVKGSFNQTIHETRISDKNWTVRHWKTISRCYAKAPFFHQHAEFLESLYLECDDIFLSAVNFRFIKAIGALLGIKTKFSYSKDYMPTGNKTERLMDICLKAGASEYISGPSAKAYIDPDMFAAAGVNLSYMDYSKYPEYPQLFPPFEHAVSIIDLIFNIGARKAADYIRGIGN